MHTEIEQWLHHGHSVEPSTDPAKLSKAITACLSKAEALTTIGATSDLDTCNREVMENYLWTLNDLVKEARFLHGKLAEAAH